MYAFCTYSTIQLMGPGQKQIEKSEVNQRLAYKAKNYPMISKYILTTLEMNLFHLDYKGFEYSKTPSNTVKCIFEIQCCSK